MKRARDDRNAATWRSLKEHSKDLAHIAIDAAERVLRRIERDGVSGQDAKDVEKLRRPLERVEEQIESAQYLGAACTDAELERLAGRLRERIAAIEQMITAARPN